MKEIILKGVKKAKGYYEIEMPKHNGYIWSYVANDKIFLQLNEEILDDIEKEYLRAVIKPFRNRVKYIKKHTYYEKEYIEIYVKGEAIIFPYFKKNTMYKGMEKYKEYTLEELGL
jgi:hypothetical protein